MANYTVTIDDKNVAVYTAFCNGRIDERLKLLVDGDVATAVAYASQSDEAGKAAKVAAQEAYEAKVAAMAEKEKTALQGLLDGKTLEEVTSASAEEPKP